MAKRDPREAMQASSGLLSVLADSDHRARSIVFRAMGIAARYELVPSASQFLAQGLVVVDLAIEDDPKEAVGGLHRLMAGAGEVDDR